MLRLVNLGKRYQVAGGRGGSDEAALSQVNLSIDKGEIVALIGPSGAGKSTLIRCINRLIEPSAGEVWLDEIEITGLSRSGLRQARKRMGMIFQEYALVERLTVMENVLSGQLGQVGFWRSYFRRFPVQTLMDAAALLDRVGLYDQLNKRADALSGGQRQRVGIARAILQHPQILLVDEPTASLDPRTARQIMRLLCELCEEKDLSAIINIHDVVLARQFTSRIIGLRQGRVVFDGGPDALSESVLTDIYGEEDWSQQAGEALIR